VNLFLRIILVSHFAGLFLLGPAAAQDSPHAGIPLEPVTVNLDGRGYGLGYRRYPEPFAVKLSGPADNPDSAYGSAHGFWLALATAADYDAVAAWTRDADGKPSARPSNEAAHMDTAHAILAGGVLLYGEIVYGDYHIFIYRYPKSIPRNLGLPVRRFGNRYYVVPNLVDVDPLAGRMSALRWDMDRLRAEHPAK